MDERGAFRGDALVTYEDPNASLTAPGFYDGGDFHGSEIKVEIAKKEEEFTG
jgi:RNA recognition motif-containing protein